MQDIEKRIEQIEKEIEIIRKRNKKVETDKAWEISLFRTLLISLSIYLVSFVAFYFIGIRNYLVNALIPTIGYFLSTRSFTVIKKWWIERKI